jgi:chloramphenicol-sensitive protein RarD
MLAHRVVWALPVTLLLVARRRRLAEPLAALRDPRHRRVLVASALLVTTNWGVFIWAVQNDLVLHASLGYYVNPILNVALGVVFLGERLTRRQGAAVALAAAGVAWLTVSVGSLPWVALALAATFAAYGLLRKTAGVDALVGLTVETLLLAPLGLAFLVVLAARGAAAFPREDVAGLLAIAASGLVTALPLLWFVHGARRLRYSTIGFFQYLAPTGQFALALAFGEPFTTAHAVAFGLIWAAVVLYLSDPRSPQGAPRRRGPT